MLPRESDLACNRTAVPAIALLDHGSREPAAKRHVRALASALSENVGVEVTPVSWSKFASLPTAAPGNAPVWILEPWVRAHLAAGRRKFLFAPFLISNQGAISSTLRAELDQLAIDAGGFEFSFTPGLTDVLGLIVSDYVRQVITERKLERASVIVVDHGGPSSASAALRHMVTSEVREQLHPLVGPVAAASIESSEGPELTGHHPLLAELLTTAGFNRGPVIIAPLFLSPGRHAGAEGDLRQIVRAAAVQFPGLDCQVTDLVGTHPLVVDTLSRQLRVALTPRGQGETDLSVGE